MASIENYRNDLTTPIVKFQSILLQSTKKADTVRADSDYLHIPLQICPFGCLQTTL